MYLILSDVMSSSDVSPIAPHFVDIKIATNLTDHAHSNKTKIKNFMEISEPVTWWYFLKKHS